MFALGVQRACHDRCTGQPVRSILLRYVNYVARRCWVPCDVIRAGIACQPRHLPLDRRWVTWWDVDRRVAMLRCSRGISCIYRNTLVIASSALWVLVGCSHVTALDRGSVTGDN